jgi:hypothetical protein
MNPRRLTRSPRIRKSNGSTSCGLLSAPAARPAGPKASRMTRPTQNHAPYTCQSRKCTSRSYGRASYRGRWPATDTSTRCGYSRSKRFYNGRTSGPSVANCGQVWRRYGISATSDGVPEREGGGCVGLALTSGSGKET